jgi:hypothetical protein
MDAASREYAKTAAIRWFELQFGWTRIFGTKTRGTNSPPTSRPSVSRATVWTFIYRPLGGSSRSRGRARTMKVLYWTYDADTHCEDCALERFAGMTTGNCDEYRDSEDESPKPAFSDSEWYANALYSLEARAVLACGTCGETIAEYDNTDAAEKDARKEGRERGENAASWLLDGNSTEDAARRLLQGIEDGDPEVMDSLPSAPLSGEWAGELLPADVLAWYGLDSEDPAAGDVLLAFEDGFSEGVQDGAGRLARDFLGMREGTRQ